MFSISVIIPTLNESSNIIALITELKKSLVHYDYEIIVVDDDSVDETAQLVKSSFSSHAEQNILCISRSWDKGLSSAVVVGAAMATKKYICVMDGDGQHNPSDVRSLVDYISVNQVDLVVGSRFLDDSSESMSLIRKAISKIGISISHLFIPKSITDPLSGFFLVKSSVINELKKRLYKGGFKILFDILMLKKDILTGEVKINFNDRQGGTSKMNIATFYHVLGQIIENLTRGLFSSSFIVFMLVGALGLVVHLSTLNILISLNLSFYFSNSVALLAALLNNYLLNNSITFGGRYVGFLEKVIGFLKYILANSLSAVANIGIASYLYSDNFGMVLSSIAGVISGIFLNYFMSKEYAFR